MVKEVGVLSYGAGSDRTQAFARENFPQTSFSPYSFCVTPIELLSNDGKDEILRRGTGFFWKRNGQSFLVTNFHVVSGKNPFTLQFLGNKAFVPRKLRFHIPSVSIKNGILKISRHSMVMKLEEEYDAIIEQPIEVDGKVIDIFALPIANGLLFEKDKDRKGFSGSEAFSAFLNDQDNNHIQTDPGDDCLVLGYPLGNYDGFMPPVWKRASVASEPGVAVHDLPVFLIDAATTPSMSGAPILRRVVTAVGRDTDGAIRELSTYSFIGVYAGRLLAKELEQTQIGYGWYATMIDRVIDSLKYTIVRGS